MLPGGAYLLKSISLMYQLEIKLVLLSTTKMILSSLLYNLLKVAMIFSNEFSLIAYYFKNCLFKKKEKQVIRKNMTEKLITVL